MLNRRCLWQIGLQLGQEGRLLGGQTSQGSFQSSPLVNAGSGLDQAWAWPRYDPSAVFVVWPGDEGERIGGSPCLHGPRLYKVVRSGSGEETRSLLAYARRCTSQAQGCSCSAHQARFGVSGTPQPGQQQHLHPLSPSDPWAFDRTCHSPWPQGAASYCSGAAPCRNEHWACGWPRAERSRRLLEPDRQTWPTQRQLAEEAEQSRLQPGCSLTCGLWALRGPPALWARCGALWPAGPDRHHGMSLQPASHEQPERGGHRQDSQGSPQRVGPSRALDAPGPGVRASSARACRAFPSVSNGLHLGDVLLGLLLSILIGGAAFFILRSNAFRRMSRHRRAAAVEVGPAGRLVHAAHTAPPAAREGCSSARPPACCCAGPQAVTLCRRSRTWTRPR